MQDRDCIKSENKTVATCSEGDEHKNQRYGVTIYIPQTVLEEYCAGQKEDPRRDTFRKRLEIAALLVAAFYAATTYKMWRTAQAQIELAGRQFEATEAPFIVFTAKSPFKIAEFSHDINDPFYDPNWVKVIVHFKNIGRTTAQKVFIETDNVLSGYGASRAPFTNLSELQQRDYDLNGFDIAPNAPSNGGRDIPVAWYQEIQDHLETLIVVTRVRYSDSVGLKCAAFEAAYAGPNCGFIPFGMTAFLTNEICNSENFQVLVPRDLPNCWKQSSSQKQ